MIGGASPATSDDIADDTPAPEIAGVSTASFFGVTRTPATFFTGVSRGARVFETIIHRNVKLEESPAFHQPVQLYAPNSRGALLYSELTDEILKRLGARKTKGKLKLAGEETRA